MKPFRWFALVIVITLLTGCVTGDGGLSFFPTPTPLPPPQVGITRAADATLLKGARERHKTVRIDGVTDAAYLRFEVPSRMLAVWSDLDYAAVEFESSLEPGNEVELYPGTSADVLPWTLRTPPERVLWVAGARTGDCVRFDLTPLVRAHGQEEQAEEHLSRSISLFEELGALPELAEAYLAKAQFLLRLGRLDEGGYYLERAEAQISCTDCISLQIQLLQAKGVLYARQGRQRDAEICLEKALASARLSSSLHEEAKCMALLGRLALQVKDYPRALQRLQQALAASSRIGAMYDVVCIYRDMSRLFAAQGDGVRAQEMAVLADHQQSRPVSSDPVSGDLPAFGKIVPEQVQGIGQNKAQEREPEILETQLISNGR